LKKAIIRSILCLFLFLSFVPFSLLFSQKKLSPIDLIPVYEKWLEEEVVYIIAPKERDVFLQLQTDREREIFIKAFWKQRDPNPNIPGNEFKEEHYRRIDYANNWFGKDSPGRGWRKARGRIYITLGPPKSIERYENSGEMYPVIIWFYEGMVEYKLPNAFNVVFFKKDGIGEYMLYSPVRFGPQNLLVHYYGDMTKYTEAFYKLMDIEPAVAKVSLNLLPNESSYALTPSLSSEVLVSQKIPAAPYEKVKDSWADKLLKYKDIIEVDYTANYIECDSLARVIQDGSGNHFVHYLIEPSRLTFEQLQDKYHSNLEITGQISDESGKSIYQFDKTIPIEFDEDQMSSIRNKLFSFQDMFPLVTGTYKFSVLMKNVVSREFTSVERDLIISNATFPQISQLTLANRLDKSLKYKDRNKPFLIGDFQLIPSPRSDFTKEDTLYVYFQIQGWEDKLKESASLQYFILKEDVEVITRKKNLNEYPDLTNIFEEFVLINLPPDYYKIKVSLINKNREEIFSREAPFLITPRQYLSRPWVISMPMVTSEDPIFANILGNQFLNKNEEAKARTYLEGAYNRNPNNPKFALDLSNLLYKAKEFQRVKQIADPFMHDERKNKFLQTMGNSSQALGEYIEAISFYQEYLSFYGTNIFILNSIGDCYFQLNNTEEALKAWEKSLEISPDQEKIKTRVKNLREKK
jgi:GWxTD domain-containing protein